MFYAFIAASAGLICQVQADPDVWSEAARAAEVSRLIQAATPLLTNTDHDAKYPVRTLGILRAEEAVPLLVKHISYMPPARKGSKITPSKKSSWLLRDMLPCVDALAKIGHPAFDAVVKKVCETDDTHTVMCVAITLRVGFGADDAITLLRAREAACKVAREKSRIKQVITSIDEGYRQVNFR